MQKIIKEEIQKSRAVLDAILNQESLLNTLEEVANACVHSLKLGGKILFAGNGGSAADAQHLATELVCRYTYDRPSIPALALTTDTSALTAIGNDYSFEYLFARQLESLGNKGDVFIGISTSGKSKNILKALETAQKKQVITIGLTGKTSPLMTPHCNYLINVPSVETSKIQESHILIGHILCHLIQESLYSKTHKPQTQVPIAS